MKVIIREAAFDDLNRIHAWIAKDRPGSADAVVDRILESTGGSAVFPTWATLVEREGTLEWVIPGLPYVIVYRVREDEDFISIDAVFHGAQDREDQR
jgi:toxin ParE1/3/4